MRRERQLLLGAEFSCLALIQSSRRLQESRIPSESDLLSHCPHAHMAETLNTLSAMYTLSNVPFKDACTVINTRGACEDGSRRAAVCVVRLFARALYDNTAETEDELAFHKGDIIMVLEKNVVGSTGWWKCSLHGRQGLAPANRLAPLLPADSENLSAEKNYRYNNYQNIYQTPKGSLPDDTAIYEDMNTASKVPFEGVTPPNKQGNVERTGSQLDALSSPTRTGTEVYDVPNLGRKLSLLTVATLPLPAPPDPNYDIPKPAISEAIKRPPYGYSTLPNPCKSEWIYDIPVFQQKQECKPGLPPKTVTATQPIYDTLPTHVWPESCPSTPQPLYDIPKPSSPVVQSCTDINNSTDLSIYDIPPHNPQIELTRRKRLTKTDNKNRQEPLENSCNPGANHRWSSKGRIVSRHAVEGTIRRDNDHKDHQRSSTVSTSSTASSSSRSSCDSFMLSSPEPEPLRELTLSQEEASNRLLELQEAVCQSVPKLMLFVSSHWRSKDHLAQHLHQIHTAAEDVTDSLNSFLKFALDVRGNAQRLTDSNLQTRLLKQLSVVEDSGLILQQAASALQDLGWQLEKLALNDGHSQMPDHLERFVMVARTVPEDVKRLVSILNANGKLLFKGTAKKLNVVENAGSPKEHRQRKSEPTVDSGIDECDYVQLQTKAEIALETKTTKSSFKSRRNGDGSKKQSSQLQPCSPPQSPKSQLISVHCRLYFGAIQKAIGVFLRSLDEHKPPEEFISNSKLVIMVGQRLVSSLYSEAKGLEASQEMLSISNQLCVLLKELAMVTKKAALSFPEKLAMQEAHGTASELAQRVMHFRMSLDV
ncbi:hypothetical protein DNTS_029261 [Danionella cerebrum]|uniref:SH3 domain-containing protein n=1 Tax=Danionella cerebrum TaxID=2873325 RepID=A0A553QRJ7_9TELE|nr:hypothetical protein DNTS_029261 [Danionella translucida]